MLSLFFYQFAERFKLNGRIADAPSVPTDQHISETPAIEPLRQLPLLLGTLFVASIALLGYAALNTSGATVGIAVYILGLFALGTERIDITLGPLSVTGGFLPAVAICVLSPEVAPVLGLAALIGSYPNWRSRLVNMSISVLSCAAGGAAALLVGAPTSALGTTIGAAAAATVCFVLVNSILVGLYIWQMGHASPRELAPQLASSLLATSAFFAPIVGILCTLVVLIDWWIIPIMMAPLVLCQYFLTLYHRKVELTSELAEKAQVLARTNLQFAAAMVKALDARDAYTAGHSAAVAVYTRDIAREMGFDEETIRVAHLAGLLHDIGKIGVPGRVLNKTAPLDDDEYELMKSHAAMGAEILGEVDLYSDIAILVRYHHERIDGRGYPDQIAGDAIPAISRMISVADTYSAMTTDRPYREGMPTEKAMSILRECRGTQLDKDFTDAFLRILVVADADYQRGKQTDFDVEVAKHEALSAVEAEAIRVSDPAFETPQTFETPQGDVIELELEREAA